MERTNTLVSVSVDSLEAIVRADSALVMKKYHDNLKKFSDLIF